MQCESDFSFQGYTDVVGPHTDAVGPLPGDATTPCDEDPAQAPGCARNQP